MSTGKKDDTGKPRWSLLPDGVIDDVIAVLEFGADKYGADNWQQVENAKTRYYDAAMRHIHAWKSGEHLDSESGKHHLSHAICCLMFLMAKDIKIAKLIDGLKAGSVFLHNRSKKVEVNSVYTCGKRQSVGAFLGDADTKDDSPSIKTHSDEDKPDWVMSSQGAQIDMEASRGLYQSTDNCNTGDQTEVLPLPTLDSGLFDEYPDINHWRVDEDGFVYGYYSEPSAFDFDWRAQDDKYPVGIGQNFDASNWKTWKLDRPQPEQSPQKQQCETEADDLTKHVAPSTKVTTVGDEIKRWDVVEIKHDKSAYFGKIGLVVNITQCGGYWILLNGDDNVLIREDFYLEKLADAEAFLFRREMGIPEMPCSQSFRERAA